MSKRHAVNIWPSRWPQLNYFVSMKFTGMAYRVVTGVSYFILTVMKPEAFLKVKKIIHSHSYTSKERTFRDGYKNKVSTLKAAHTCLSTTGSIQIML